MKKIVFTLIAIFAIQFVVSAQKIINKDIESAEISINKLGINTPVSDFGPCIVEGNLLFSTIPEKPDRKLKKEGFYDLVSARILSSGNVGDIMEMVNGIDGKYHEGPVSYCKKTKELFISFSNSDNSEILYNPFQTRKVRLKIVIARQNEAGWYIYDEFEHNHAKYSVGHPAINPAGDTLIFVSDMKGRIGETDLFMSIRSGDSWSEPQNLGEVVNTEGKEFTPFISSDGMLYFSSDGFGNSEGLDIYAVKLSDLPGGKLTKLPSPINTVDDDFDFTLHENLEYGFLTSTRDNNENDEIYSVIIDYPEPIVYHFLGKVLDAESKKPVSEAKVVLNNKDQIPLDKNAEFKLVMEEGLTYKATASSEGYLVNSVLFSIDELSGGKTQLEKTILLYKDKVDKVFTINNIYYEFDKWNLLDKSKVELDKLVIILNENPEMKAEMGSHTDSRGSDQYNDKLSQKRSESVVNYLISKGISSSRISAKGYGESQLVNKCKDGVSCTKEEHQLNRRTTFKITENITSLKTEKKKLVSEANIELKNKFWIQILASGIKQNIEEKFPALESIFGSYETRELKDGVLFKYQLGPFNQKGKALEIINLIEAKGVETVLKKYESNSSGISLD